MFKIVFTNILLFIGLYIFYLAASFGFGFAIEALSKTASGILYIIIPLVHLYINYRMAKKWNCFTRQYLIISSLLIAGVWFSYPYLLNG